MFIETFMDTTDQHYSRREAGTDKLGVQFCDGYAYGMLTRQPVSRAVSHLVHFMLLIDAKVARCKLTLACKHHPVLKL